MYQHLIIEVFSSFSYGANTSGIEKYTQLKHFIPVVLEK